MKLNVGYRLRIFYLPKLKYRTLLAHQDFFFFKSHIVFDNENDGVKNNYENH